MDELESLVRAHRFKRNEIRLNISPGERVHYGKKVYLKEGVFSNTLRSGPVLAVCQHMLGADVNAVCLNRDVCCAMHRDKNNAGDSFICYFGDFEGGALVLDDGRRFEEKGV